MVIKCIVEADNEIEMLTQDETTLENDQDSLSACARINGVTDIQLMFPVTITMIFVESALASKHACFTYCQLSVIPGNIMSELPTDVYTKLN